MIEIYTDGSCFPNDGTGKGGYAFIVVEDNNLVHQYSRKQTPTTNNRMELQAIIDAINFIEQEVPNEKVIIFSDSKYCVNGYNKWMYSWQRYGWRTSMGGKVKNQDLWEELFELNNYNVKWVKGHSDNKWNELADQLADYKS